MFDFLKKKDENSNNVEVLIFNVVCLLIHAAKIDENYTEKEKNIIIKALIEMGANKENLEDIITEAEKKEQDSLQHVSHDGLDVTVVTFQQLTETLRIKTHLLQHFDSCFPRAKIFLLLGFH